MSFVIVSVAFNLPGAQLQFWLGTIQSLNLRLFVNRQNQGIIGRVQVQAHHIKNLLGKVWIVADLEHFQTVKLQICGLPAGYAISRMRPWVEPRETLCTVSSRIALTFFCRAFVAILVLERLEDLRALS
jgi:hypothetical protein